MSLLPSLVSRVMLRNNVWGGGGGIRGGGGSLLPSSGCRQTADSHLGPPTSHNPPFSHLTLPANGQADCLPVLAEQATGPELEWGRWLWWGAEQRRRFQLFIWGGFSLRMTFPPPCSGFELLLVIWLARISWQPKVNWHLTEVFKEKWSCQWSRKGAKDNCRRSKTPLEWGAI